MVKSTGTYTGGLNCQLIHGPSGAVIETDAPTDNHGRGAAFSPTDLAAASLASCMVTTMAIAAKLKLDLDIPGVRWAVAKEMSTDKPRRIVSLAVEIWLPFPKSIDPENILEKAALACPVQQSLNPCINCPVVFHWEG
jgi:putative redox protein